MRSARTCANPLRRVHLPAPKRFLGLVKFVESVTESTHLDPSVSSGITDLFAFAVDFSPLATRILSKLCAAPRYLIYHDNGH